MFNFNPETIVRRTPFPEIKYSTYNFRNFQQKDQIFKKIIKIHFLLNLTIFF